MGGLFYWLLKAWKEPDPIARFVYLFIPLEALIDPAQDVTRAVLSLRRIAEIVEASQADDRAELVRFLTCIEAKFGPALLDRFSEMARRLQPERADVDLTAFKGF